MKLTDLIYNESSIVASIKVAVILGINAVAMMGDIAVIFQGLLAMVSTGYMAWRWYKDYKKNEAN